MTISFLRRLLWLLALSLVTLLGAHGAFAKSLCEKALTVYEVHIVQTIKPQRVIDKPDLRNSVALNGPWLELARQTKAWKDFKPLSDLEPIELTEGQKQKVSAKAREVRERIKNQLIGKGIKPDKAASMAETARARWMVNHLFKMETGLKSFNHPIVDSKWMLKPTSVQTGLNFQNLSAGFDHVENMWSRLVKITAQESKNSLLPSPYPKVIPGDRFQEGYYWDTYVGAVALTLTDRLDLAAAHLEGFLHDIQVYGIVPNANRDYYLGRSQPPVMPLFAQLIYEASQSHVDPSALDHWWKARVYPLLIQDYNNFWRTRRFDSKTKLYFHDDNLEELLEKQGLIGEEDLLRPERHSNDDEYSLGITPRAVRAEAEYGRDHTDATMRDGNHMATVELNSLMYAYGKLLAKMAKQFGHGHAARMFERQAEETKAAMNKHLWDERVGVFKNFHLTKNIQTDVVASDLFWTLHTGMASPSQAKRIVEFAERELEGGAGIRGSTADSDKQWDRKYFWAMDNFIAAAGANRYGHSEFAHRITTKFLKATSDIYMKTGHFYEKIGEDQLRGQEATPDDDDTKYPNQTGFLWTNAYYVWGLKFLGYEFTPQ